MIEDSFLPSGNGSRPPPCCVWMLLVICWLPRGSDDDDQASGSPITTDIGDDDNNNNSKNNNNPSLEPPDDIILILQVCHTLLFHFFTDFFWGFSWGVAQADWLIWGIRWRSSAKFCWEVERSRPVASSAMHSGFSSTAETFREPAVSLLTVVRAAFASRRRCALLRALRFGSITMDRIWTLYYC